MYLPDLLVEFRLLLASCRNTLMSGSMAAHYAPSQVRSEMPFCQGARGGEKTRRAQLVEAGRCGGKGRQWTGEHGRPAAMPALAAGRAARLGISEKSTLFSMGTVLPARQVHTQSHVAGGD